MSLLAHLPFEDAVLLVSGHGVTLSDSLIKIIRPDPEMVDGWSNGPHVAMDRK